MNQQLPFLTGTSAITESDSSIWSANIVHYPHIANGMRQTTDVFLKIIQGASHPYVKHNFNKTICLSFNGYCK